MCPDGDSVAPCEGGAGPVVGTCKGQFRVLEESPHVTRGRRAFILSATQHLSEQEPEVSELDLESGGAQRLSAEGKRRTRPGQGLGPRLVAVPASQHGACSGAPGA